MNDYKYIIELLNIINMNITEEQLKLYVDNVFKKYDNNGNFVLEEDELYLFFKDLFASMNFKH